MLRTLHTLAACSVLALLAACGAGGPSQAGTYAFDAEASLERSDLDAMPAEGSERLKSMVRNIESELTLADSHEYSMWMKHPASGEREELKGTWSAEGEVITLEQTEANGEERPMTNTMTLDGHELVMTQGGNEGSSMQLVFLKR